MNFLQKLFGSAASPENPKLIRAMERAAKERTEDARSHVHRELMRSNLYLAIPAPIDCAKNCRWTKLKEGLELKCLSTRNTSGEVVVPVFTDEATLGKWKPNAFWIAMPASELFPVLLQSELAQLVINPGGSTGGILMRGN